MMLLGRKLEVIKYLRKLPIEESTKMRNKLLRGLDKIRERRAALKKKNAIPSNSSNKDLGSKDDEVCFLFYFFFNIDLLYTNHDFFFFV